jgi:hypothetical protein
MLPCLDFADAWHSRESDPVLDDPNSALDRSNSVQVRSVHEESTVLMAFERGRQRRLQG